MRTHAQDLGDGQVPAPHEEHVDVVRREVLGCKPPESLVVLDVHDLQTLRRVARVIAVD